MRSITFRFILAFAAVSLISTLLVVAFTRWRSREEFRTFLIDQNRPGIVVAFSDYYRLHGSWQGITPSDVFPHPTSAPGMPLDVAPFTLVDGSTHRVVLAGEGYEVGRVLPPAAIQNGIPIQSDNKTIGVLMVNRPGYRIGAPGSAFLARINLQTLLGGLVAIALALVLAVVLARTLTNPIRELTAATRVVSEGDFGHQVPVRSNDELGQLALSFNRMSADLVRSVNLRRQMTADVAHELRTPISVILGHAEAVHDGVLPASNETFEIVREEALRLERLVDDLRTLSMADAGELKLDLVLCEPGKLLSDAQRTFAHKAGQKQVALDVEAAENLPEVQADPQRMQEIFANIVDNAIRYTPPDGRIVLSAQRLADAVEFRIHDTGPGIGRDELQSVFERFHRAETSRTRDEGGSGLGLAIAKSMVEKHGGTIWAESPAGGGLTVVIRLPIPLPLTD